VENPYYLAPSELTSGKGFDFEDLVASWLSTCMLCALPLSPVCKGEIKKITFQVGNSGWLLDDILLTVKKNGRNVNCAISIKSNMQFTAKKAPADFVEAIWRHYLHYDDNELFNKENDYLGIITGSLSGAAKKSLNSLLSKVQHSIDDELSVKMKNGQFSKDITDLYNSFSCPSDLKDNHSVIAIDQDNLLKRLIIFSSDINEQQSSYLNQSLLNCQAALKDPKSELAQNLFDRLHLMVKSTRVNEGSLDNAAFIRQLSHEFSFKGHSNYFNDINILAEYSQNVQDNLPHLIGGRLEVERSALRNKVKAELEKHPLLVMVGESGSGKSVLARSIAHNEFRGKTLWLDSYLIESENLKQAENKLNIEHPWSDLVEHLPCDDYLVVVDGLDRVNDNYYSTAAQLIRPLLLSKKFTLLITCQQSRWETLQRGLIKHIGVIITPKLFTIENFTEDEINQIISSFPQFEKIFQSSRLQPLLKRPKIIDLFSGFAQLPDTSKWTSEADLIEWYWQTEFTDKIDGAMREAFSLTLAEKLADALQSSVNITNFPTADLIVLGGLEKDGICQRNKGRVSFTHDLFLDWFKQRVLWMNLEEEQEYLFSKINLPSWYRAITLLGLHLLDNNQDTSIWFKLIKKSLANKEWFLTTDLLLESIIYSSQPEVIMTKLWPELIDDKASLLKRLLKRFLFVATQPDPLTMKVTEQLGADTLLAMTWNRHPILNYWYGFLAVIKSKQNEFIQLAPTQTAHICQTWLKHTPKATRYRKTLGDIAIKMSWKALQHNQHRRYHDKNRWLSYDDEHPSFFYQTGFAAIHDNMDEIIEFSYCATGLSKPTTALPADPEPEPITDPIWLKRVEELEAQSSDMDNIYGKKVFKPSLSGGPIFPVDQDFRYFFLYTMYSLPLIVKKSAKAAHIILALCIKEGGKSYSSYHLSRDKQYGLVDNLNLFPVSFDKGPFFHLLAVSPNEGMRVILRLTEIASQKWLENKEHKKLNYHETSTNENFPLTLDIELNGESKTWIGERRWMYSCRVTVPPPKLLICALMALEKWLSDKIDDDEDVSDDIRHLLTHSNSMTIIGVCLQLAKKQTLLFKGVCADFLNIPELFIYDFYHVLDSESHQMMAFGYKHTEKEINAAKAWHLREYRKENIENIILQMMINDPAFKIIVTDKIWPAFKHWLDSTTEENPCHPITSELVHKLDLKNWVYQKVELNKYIPIYTPPKVIEDKWVAKSKENDITQSLSVIPIRCRELINNGIAPNSADIKESLETFAKLKFDNDSIDRKLRLVRTKCALAAALYIYKNQLNDIWVEYEEWCYQTILGCVFEQPEIELRIADTSMDFEWDRFCTDVIPLMWLEYRDNKDIRSAIGHLCISFHYETVERLFRIVSDHRAEFRDDFYRLIHLATRWSVYRERILIASNEIHGEEKLSVEQLYSEFERYFLKFIDASLPVEIPTWESLEHTFYNEIYISEEYGLSKAHRRSTGIDFAVIKRVYDWLPTLDRAINSTEKDYWLSFWKQCSQTILWQMDYGVQKVDEVDGVPYAFDKWLLGKLPHVILSCDSTEEARSLWQPLLELGVSAHLWIDEFLYEWFSALGSEKIESAVFLSHWNEMIQFVLNNKNWQKPGGSKRDLDKIWDSIFGLNQIIIDYIWNQHHVDIVKGMSNELDVHASKKLSQESLDKLIRFLRTRSAYEIRHQGLTWIDKCLEELTWSSNESDKNTEEQLVVLVKLVLDDIGDLNKLSPETKIALLRILRQMAEHQNTMAMAIVSENFDLLFYERQ